MPNAINNTQKTTQEATVDTTVNTTHTAGETEMNTYQSNLQVPVTAVPTHTTTQGVQMNPIQRIQQATSLTEIKAISEQLSHKSKKVANAIANVTAALSTSATLLVRRPASIVTIPKSEWPSTIEGKKLAAKRAALKLVRKVESVETQEGETATQVVAEVTPVAPEPTDGWFCPAALVCLSKALGLTSFRLSDLNLNLLESHIAKSITKTNTTTHGSQSTAEAGQLQPKQGERNMIANQFSIPDTQISVSLLTEPGFKSTDDILSWFESDLTFTFNGFETKAQVINQGNPGQVDLNIRKITLSDALTLNQMVRALVHELDHLNYADLIESKNTDQIQFLKSLDECKAHSNHPEFLNDNHAEEELWVRYRDYLRGDDTYQLFFTWYESTTTTEASKTSQQKENKVKTSSSKNTQKKVRAAERVTDADLTNLTEEIVFLKSKHGIRFISDICSSWASPLNQTKKVLGLKGKLVKVSFRDLSFAEMIKVQKALNQAGWYFVSQNMICKEEDAKEIFHAAKKVFKNLTGFVNYGKAWFTTPCKPSLDYVVGLINEEEIAELTGNDGSGFLTAGVHFSLMQFRSTGLNEGLFGKGIVTHTKLIIEDNKVVSIDSLVFGEKETRDFQSWLNNSNSPITEIDGKEYKKALMLCASNLKGILKDVPNDDSFREVDTDFFSLMAGDLDLKEGKLTMPNQISFYAELDSTIIDQLVEKSLQKAKNNLRKFVLLENLTEEVISLCKTKFDTKYVQMSNLNIASENENDQDKVIEGSINFILKHDDFETGELKKDVWMVRTPVQDQNALNLIPSYNPTIVHDILHLTDDQLSANHPDLDRKEIVKIKMVFDTLKKKLQFSSLIAPIVKQGIMWLDTRVQEILVGDNDGDMNSYKEKGKSEVIDNLFTKSKAYKAKEIIKKETSKAFVLDSESSDDWCDERSQQRLITPNGGQLNVGAISNLQVAVRSQLGFDKLPDVVTFVGKTISGIQQPSIDRQKYKYVLPSLQHWYLLRGPVKINLDGKEKSLIIPGVSWVAKGETNFKEFDEKKQWTTRELSEWFKQSFGNYDDFSEEIITDIAGEEINAYDPEGYNSLGCQAWGQKLILAVKLLSGDSELAKKPLDDQIMAVAEMMEQLESESINEETMKVCGICEEELDDSFYSLKWLKQIQHESCPASLVVLRDKLSKNLVLEDLLAGIVDDYKSVYAARVNNSIIGLDTDNQESVVNFGKLLSRLFIAQKDQVVAQLENTNRSTQKQQELSTLGSWVAAANDCGLDWLVAILANNKLDIKERQSRLSDFKKALAWTIVNQIHCYFNITDKVFLSNVNKGDLISFLLSIVKLLDAVEEAESNASSVSWTNQLLVNAAITFKKGIQGTTDLKDLVAKFEEDALNCLVQFIKEQHFGGDQNVSHLNIINSHHWNKYSFVMNIAKRPAKALELYTSYDWDQKDFKDSLVDLVLKEVGRKDNRKLIVPTKVTYLLNDKWWGDMVKGLTKTQTVNIYYRTLCDGNGDVGYVVESQTQKAWLTFTSKHADKFETLAPYGLSEVVSSTQLNNLLIDNSDFAVDIVDDDSVSEARKALGCFGDYRDLKHLVAEIIKGSLVIKGYIKNYDDFEQTFVAVPYGYLTTNVNHKAYSTNFRNAMHFLYGVEKAGIELISEKIDNKDFDGAFDLMYPVEMRKGLLNDFNIDLAGFKTRSEISLFDETKAAATEVYQQRGPRIVKKQKIQGIWADFREKQQNLSYKKMKQVEINLDEELAYLGNQSPTDLFNKIGSKEDYRARLLLLNRDFLLVRNLETMLNIGKQLSSHEVDKDQLIQIYENCKNSLLREIGNPSLKKMVYSAITDPHFNGLSVIANVDSNDLMSSILKD